MSGQPPYPSAQPTGPAPSLPPHATGVSVVQDRLYGLLSMPLFSSVAAEDLRALLEVAQWVEIAPGEQLENTRASPTANKVLIPRIKSA